MEEEKKKEKVDIFPTVAIVFIICCMIVAAFYFGVGSHPEINHLRNEISFKKDVSNDYRQGWNDCIKELRDYYDISMNMTNNPLMIIGGD